MRLVVFLTIAFLACVALAGQAVAQTAISADGIVESEAGGFRFPDGTLQGTAATQPGYNNRIADFSPPNPYAEVCFPGGGAPFTSDIDGAGGKSTQGGNCEPGDIGWVIELDERAPDAQWDDAVEECLTDGMRLPEAFEWKLSCDNATALTLQDVTDDNEWVANTPTLVAEPAIGLAVVVMGNGSCFFGGYDFAANATATTAARAYRCAR